MLVDTHAHLQWASFDKDREKVINQAKKAGIEYIVNIGFDVDGSIKAIDLAEKHKGLYATVGIHPHNASQFNQKVLNKQSKGRSHRRDRTRLLQKPISQTSPERSLQRSTILSRRTRVTSCNPRQRSPRRHS